MDLKTAAKRTYRNAIRYRLNKNNRSRLKNDDSNPISIISSNCVGGVILHELGIRFNSPTINLFFYPKDYLEFIKDIKHYTNVAINEISKDNSHNYPRGILDDKIQIHFLHYETFSEAKSKWAERCKRINYNNMVFIFSERDGVTREQIEMFDRIEVGGDKLILTCNEYDNILSAYNMGEAYKDRETGQLIDLCRYKGKLTGRRYIDDFDYVNFLNTRKYRG